LLKFARIFRCGTAPSASMRSRALATRAKFCTSSFRAAASFTS
jgi:hypothetical protein